MLWEMLGQVPRCRLDALDNSSLEISASEFDFHHVADVVPLVVFTKTSMPRSARISTSRSANRKHADVMLSIQRLFAGEGAARVRLKSISGAVWISRSFSTEKCLPKFASGLGCAARRIWSYYLVILVSIWSDSTASKRNASFK
jgi:hypothetical protein